MTDPMKCQRCGAYIGNSTTAAHICWVQESTTTGPVVTREAVPVAELARLRAEVRVLKAEIAELRAAGE